MAAYTTVMTGTGEIPADVLILLDAQFQIPLVGNLADQLSTRQLSGDPQLTSFTFGKINEIDSSVSAALLEYTDPVSTALSGGKSVLTAAEYGRVVTTTALADAISGGALTRAAAGAVGRDAARYQNNMVMTTLAAGTNVSTSGAVMSKAIVDTAYTKLSLAGATKDALGFYRAVMSPAQIYDLKASVASGSWTDVNKYADPATVIKGEVGTFGGFRIIESPLIVAAAGVYKALFMGADALGQGVALPVRLTLTSSDKLARFKNVGWYGIFTFGIINQAQVLVVSTTTGFVA